MNNTLHLDLERVCAKQLYQKAKPRNRKMSLSEHLKRTDLMESLLAKLHANFFKFYAVGPIIIGSNDLAAF